MDDTDTKIRFNSFKPNQKYEWRQNGRQLTNEFSLVKEFKKVKSRDAGFYEIASKAGGDEKLVVTKIKNPMYKKIMKHWNSFLGNKVKTLKNICT